MSEEIIDWVDEMIIREATPKTLRQGTVEEFAEAHGISPATYYNHSSKPANKKKIIETALEIVKKSTPEVLEKLREKAENGDTKAIEMFLDYVLKLSKNLDLKSDGQPFEIKIVNYANPDSPQIPATTVPTPDNAGNGSGTTENNSNMA